MVELNYDLGSQTVVKSFIQPVPDIYDFIMITTIKHPRSLVLLRQ